MEKIVIASYPILLIHAQFVFGRLYLDEFEFTLAAY